MANRPTLSKQADDSSLIVKSRNRVPVSGNRDILTVKGRDPNFVYRWVLKEPQRITKFEEAGYSIVTREELEIGQNRIDQSAKETDGTVYTRNGGRGVELVLMKQQRIYYDEDQAAKQAEVSSRESDMHRTSLSQYGTPFANELNVSKDK